MKAKMIAFSAAYRTATQIFVGRSRGASKSPSTTANPASGSALGS